MVAGEIEAKPKGRTSAFSFFVQKCREEHKKRFPEDEVVFQEFSKKCAERWKTMTDREKKWFNNMAETDKIRFETEMSRHPSANKMKKGKKAKDPNAPKRALSGFFWFSNDERGKVKAANPDFQVGDVAKELGRRWAEASPEFKSKYEEMAEKDRKRYEKEKIAYNNIKSEVDNIDDDD